MMQKNKKQPELVQGNGEMTNGRFDDLDYFFEQSFDMMCITGSDGHFQRVNPAFEHVLGWAANELISTPYLDYVHPDDVTNVRTEQEKLNQGQASEGYEHRFRCQDGAYKWLSWNAHPTPEGLVYAVARDVTNYRQTEENLRSLTEEMRETTSFLYSIIENLPTMLTIKDAEALRYIRFNKAGEDMLGLTAEEVLGKNDYDVFRQDLADFFSSTDREVLTSGETLDIPEELIETTHRGTRIFRTRKLPILDSDGHSKYLLSLSEDITERKQVEEAIAKQAVELQNVAEISTAVANRTKPENILQTAVDLSRDSFNFYHVHIYLLNEAGDELSVIAGSGKVGRQIASEGRCIPLTKEQSLVARAARTHRGVIVNDVESDSGFLPHPLLPYTRSEMAIPMVVGQQMLGVLDVQAEEPDRFIDTDIQIISTLAAQIATTLQNARRFEQIQESEAKYRNILENIESGYYETTLEGNFQFFNEALCRIFGYPAAELQGMNYKQMMVEEDGERVYKTFNSVYKTGEPVQSFEYQHIRQDGNLRVINLSISRMEDATGKPTGFRGLSRDVTERRQAQVRQQQAEQATQEFLERMKALNEATVELSQTETLDKLYKRAIKLGIGPLGFDRIGFYTRADDENPYLLTATFGTDVEGQIRDERSLTMNLSDIPQYVDMIDNKERLLISKDADLWDNGQIVGRGWHITLPVWDDEEFLGIFFVDNLHRQQPLKSYEPELLTLYSTTIASLVGQKRSEEAIAKQAVELEAVAQLSAAISQTLDPSQLLQRVVDLSKARFNLYHAHIYLMGARHQTLHLAAGAGEIGLMMVTEGRQIPLYLEQSLIAQAARERQGIIANDVQANPNFLPHPLLPDTRAEMAIPIMLAEEVVGVLDIQSDQVGYFTEEDIRIQTTLATQVAVALQNSRLFAESEAARAELSLLTRRLTREGWQDYMATQASDIVFDYGIGEIESGEKKDTTIPKIEQTLVVQGEPIGRLALDDPAALSDDAANIMAAVAERLSTHIENLRLSEQTQIALSDTEEQARRLALLNEMSATLNSANTLEEVYQMATEQTAKILGVERVSLPLLTKDGENMVVVAFSGDEYEANTGTVIPLADPMSTALHENHLVINNNPTGNMKTVMVAPLRVAGRSIGTINIGSKSKNAFTSRDENLLLQIASLLTARIENLRLFTEAQARANRERRVRTITDKIRRATNREAILQVAREEISDLLGASQSAVHLGHPQKTLSPANETTDSSPHKGKKEDS